MMAPKNKRIGIYAGSFDPVTLGHLDVIKRARPIVDELIVAVSTHKRVHFSGARRVALVKEAIAPSDDGVRVMPFEGLLVDFAHAQGASLLIRGLRAVSDFEYEFKMAAANNRLDEEMETIFLMASSQHQFTSSDIVREIASLGGDVASFVPAGVVAAFKEG